MGGICNTHEGDEKFIQVCPKICKKKYNEAWSHTSSYVFMAWYLDKHGENK
jgi:hypothetical protein